MDVTVLDSRRLSWRGSLYEYYVSKVDRIFIVHEASYLLPSTTLDVREQLRDSMGEFADLIPDNVAKVHFPQVAGITAKKNIHYFGLPSNVDTEEMAHALALGFALRNDEFFRECILPAPNEPEYSMVTHTEPFPRDYLEFELSGICQKVKGRPLQW